MRLKTEVPLCGAVRIGSAPTYVGSTLANSTGSSVPDGHETLPDFKATLDFYAWASSDPGTQQRRLSGYPVVVMGSGPIGVHR